ncbi:unnamed protein product [Somion occarium]
MKFTPEDMHMICSNDISEGGVQVWSQIKVESLFTEYRIQSNANNQITFSLSTDALLVALRSASSYSSSSATSGADIVMKLAKKQDQAVLTFEISGQSRSGKPVKITHDIRIELMRPEEVDKLAEPMCPEPQVQIILPPLAKMRTVVERLRVHSDLILFEANNSGSIQLTASNDTVSVKVEWHNLRNPPTAKVPSSQDPETASQALNERDPDEKHGVLVAFKSFQKFLNSHQLSTTTIACVCRNHALILYVYIGEVTDSGGVLTFYLPAVIDGD